MNGEIPPLGRFGPSVGMTWRGAVATIQHVITSIAHAGSCGPWHNRRKTLTPQAPRQPKSSMSPFPVVLVPADRGVNVSDVPNILVLPGRCKGFFVREVVVLARLGDLPGGRVIEVCVDVLLRMVRVGLDLGDAAVEAVVLHDFPQQVIPELRPRFQSSGSPPP